MPSVGTLGIAVLVLLASAAGAAILTPIAIKFALRSGLVDVPAPRKFHRTPVPYLGGLAVAVPAIAALIVEVAMTSNL